MENIGYVMKDTSVEPMLGTHLNNYQVLFRIHNCASQEIEEPYPTYRIIFENFES